MLTARPRRALFALALGVGALASAPGSARADEPIAPDRAKPDTYPPEATRLPTILTGAAITGVWYGAALGASYLWPDAPGARDLRIPIAGPWMALADTGCAEDDPDCSPFLVALRALLTTIDGVGQVGGLLVIGEGLFLPTTSDAPEKPKRRRRTSFVPLPTIVGRDGVGIGLAGDF